MTPEEIEKILQSNAKAIESNSTASAQTRREVSVLYQIMSKLVRDGAVMFDILRGLNEDRVNSHDNLAAIAENLARIAELLLQQRGE